MPIGALAISRATLDDIPALTALQPRTLAFRELDKHGQTSWGNCSPSDLDALHARNLKASLDSGNGGTIVTKATRDGQIIGMALWRETPSPRGETSPEKPTEDKGEMLEEEGKHSSWHSGTRVDHADDLVAARLKLEGPRLCKSGFRNGQIRILADSFPRWSSPRDALC